MKPASVPVETLRSRTASREHAAHVGTAVQGLFDLEQGVWFPGAQVSFSAQWVTVTVGVGDGG